MSKHDFTSVPMVRRPRTMMDLSHGVKTSMSVGKLYPLKVVEVLPGDTFKCDMTAVARCTSAFLKPIVDNLFMDVYHFFVPYRLVYNKTERVFGNPNPSAWIDEELADFPTLPVSEIISGTVGDYLGYSVSEGSDNPTRRYIKKGVNVLDYRSFALIYNTWFRNENTVDEVLVQTGELALSERPNNNAWSSSNYMGKLPNVGKKKDYFTSGLPGVQKGEAVRIPLGNSFNGLLPVITKNASAWSAAGLTSNSIPLQYATYTDLSLLSATSTYAPNILGIGGVSGGTPTSNYNAIAFPARRKQADDSTKITFKYSNNDTGNGDDTLQANMESGKGIVPRNLFAVADTVDISVLRDAFQLQKIKESLARGGSRYNEVIYSFFGVSTPDARLQIPEFLGGGRIPISITQVAQTSAGTESSPQANVAGYSLTAGRSRFNKAFTEYGLLFTVGCIRQEHTYQQGIPRHAMRKSRDDFYNPILANISEQPVWKSQIFGYATADNDTVDLTTTPFNYQEAWADYRYEPSIVTGQMRSGVSNSLDIWHLADYFESAPTFGQSFTDENSDNIDRVLAVGTSSQDNFLVDLWFNTKAVRVMPLYSIPGLVDHH